jgi:enoyl-CoA hydratase
MSDGALLVREESGAMIIAINRPEAMNALNLDLLDCLASILDEVAARVQQDRLSIRCLLLTGVGEKAFVAGADIKQFNSMSPAAAEEFSRRGQAVFRQLEKLPIPVVALVNGYALGGGLELALACDFIYAAPQAKFSLPECGLGLIPGFGGTVRLPRRVGMARARELMFSGKMISAEEALLIGLIAKIVVREDLLPAGLEFAKALGGRAPLALAAIKQSLDDTNSLNLDQALQVESKAFAAIFETSDMKEGIDAFSKKRAPLFVGN